MDKIENYKCRHCGKEFKISDKERFATFVLHEPGTWPCPDCGHMTFVLKDEKHV